MKRKVGFILGIIMLAIVVAGVFLIFENKNKDNVEVSKGDVTTE